MSENHEHSDHHVVPVSVYIMVFVALLMATALTTGVAYIDMGPFNTVVALLIAFIKMSLVILFFMHVKYQPGLTRLAIICAFFWLGIMMTLTLSDELSRGWEINPSPWNALMPHLPHLARLFF
jgi:cytochrome c oxidase subunit 4